MNSFAVIFYVSLTRMRKKLQNPTYPTQPYTGSDITRYCTGSVKAQRKGTGEPCLSGALWSSPPLRFAASGITAQYEGKQREHVRDRIQRDAERGARRAAGRAPLCRCATSRRQAWRMRGWSWANDGPKAQYGGTATPRTARSICQRLLQRGEITIRPA